MKARSNYFAAAPDNMALLMNQEQQLSAGFESHASLSLAMLELIKLRVSQLNRCAFCIEMHSREALRQGLSPQRLIGLSAWQEMSDYSEPERLALQLAEQLTRAQAIEDQQFAQLTEVFGTSGLVLLTQAINAINSWNRFAKVFKPVPGSMA